MIKRQNGRKNDQLRSCSFRKDYLKHPFAVTRAYQAGIRQIALATDAGNFPHGDNARDIVESVKRGIPEMFALKAATVNAAEMLGIQDSAGTIEAGKRADIIATNTSPLDDITEMTRVRFVMRDGKVYLGSRPLPVANN